MTYVDGFVAAVPTANRASYTKHAETAAVVFKEHGALRVVECWGDDVPQGKVTSFPMAVKCKDDETVVFSWITWPSRQKRDEGMKKVNGRSETSTGQEPDALRRQTAHLWRLRNAGRCVTSAGRRRSSFARVL